MGLSAQCQAESSSGTSVYLHIAETVALLERTRDAEKPVEMFGRRTTARAVYLRLLAHANEHMGQSVAYARINRCCAALLEIIREQAERVRIILALARGVGG